MTREEKIIATVFTGNMFIDSSDMGLLYEYMEKKVGHGVIDYMLASKEFWEELHKACEQDFIDMVNKKEPSLPSNLDEAAEKWKEEHFRREYHQTPKDAMSRSFKAGAEWHAGQGVISEGKVFTSAFTSYVKIPGIEKLLKDAFPADTEVIVQIRKK